MKLVADANVMFSALLRGGLTRRLWFHPALELSAPAFIIREFLKHRAELLTKYSGSGEEFERLQKLLLSQVRLVADEELQPYLPAASSLSGDAKDWLYLACALHQNAAIWSNDRDFGMQKRVEIKTTKKLAGEIGLL